MKSLHLFYLFCFLAATSCGQIPKETKTPDTSGHQHSNHLVGQSSPYLLQHAHNPVDWYPWGDEALKKAKDENKLIIVSVGYASCHWCHVMEHESFEDEEVAKFMNENFVAIKVDREERPDVDQVYMNAVQLLTGSGGWPLNCIAMPDGRPLYGGTYFPKEQWLEMLQWVLNFAKESPDKAERQATSITEGLQPEFGPIEGTETEFTSEDLFHIFYEWQPYLDNLDGGFRRAPKFPLPIGYQYLLQYSDFSKRDLPLEAITLTLDHMSRGGIYDQIGGGFARYSTDVYWKVPHFEKMLYDNAQLVSLYANAYQYLKAPEYKRIAEQSLDFIERELTSPEGAFYSSLDADSEGEEGKFYVWTQEEINEVLGGDARLISAYYNVKERGNWEKGQNILYRKKRDKAIAKAFDITEEQLRQKVDSANQRLLEKRAERVRPGLDDKVITAWNGLMLKGYVDAYRVFGDENYLKIAERSANFLATKMTTKQGRLWRNYKNGNASINGFLDDYAFTISAYIGLYQATFDQIWLDRAKQLIEYSIEHFFDAKSGMFYYTSDVDPALVARKMEIDDNVIPASNSEMAKNLFVLSHYFNDMDYREKSRHMLSQVKEEAIVGRAYYANWDILMSWFVQEPFEVAIVGKDYKKVRAALDEHYLPHVFFLGSAKESELELLDGKYKKGQTTIYVCRDKVCQKPTTKVTEALNQIRALSKTME